ncbi:D-alanyl-D-alanine carboxypeptidase [Caulobacter sp. S45]|uniref:D-alanyl-D-alanine carboxypeptidase n=1 Tax=Caulobacter sp. S45 TaxID=1641861 RepID=UPI001576A199|nr:D-alanyl-D-alanine carboxypeptidase [Caulobacter sp. S45]
MPHPARRRPAGIACAFAALAAVCAPAIAQAQGLFTQPKYAAIVEDANTGEVLYTMRADALRHPASITKIMTLYLTFEALSTGRLRMSDVITISPHAFSMMPSKVSTHAGEQLTVSEAIPAMTVHSANDVAVAMAERLSGSEGQFAQLMTARARELGMTSTTFVNASGLPPDGEQITTARDMAILSRAVMRDYPQYYQFFGLKSFTYRGKLLLNHNHLVAKMPGVDGMKTGYTSLAGFNLVASGVRDGHRLITVVLGGPSVAARDENVEELLDAGFTVLKGRAFGQRMRLASLIASPDDMSGPVTRAPIEMGSADQPNLQVEVQPTMRTLPTLEAARSLAEPPAQVAEAQPATVDCASARRGRHRRHRAAEACGDPAVAKAEAPKATAPELRPAKSRVAKVKAAEAQEDAPAKPCTPRRHHRHAAACDADTQTAVAEPEGVVKSAKTDAAKSGGGGFMIQVGAYKNHALAAGQIEKISPLVAGAGMVEEAGGNYRARFRGLSQKQAKAACHALSAKGQACMVMGAG